VALSNSSPNLIAARIRNAGLTEHFDEVVSVEEIGNFKPDRKVYEFVAKRINRPVGQLRLVATHDWDTRGALTAGMQSA